MSGRIIEIAENVNQTTTNNSSSYDVKIDDSSIRNENETSAFNSSSILGTLLSGRIVTTSNGELNDDSMVNYDEEDNTEADEDSNGGNTAFQIYRNGASGGIGGANGAGSRIYSKGRPLLISKNQTIEGETSSASSSSGDERSRDEIEIAKYVQDVLGKIYELIKRVNRIRL